MQEIFIQDERRYLARAFMNSYIDARMKPIIAREYDEQHWRGIAMLSSRGCSEEADALRRELPQRTEAFSDTGLVKAVRTVKMAINSGKL